jgi:protein-arginine kinase
MNRNTGKLSKNLLEALQQCASNIIMEDRRAVERLFDKWRDLIKNKISPDCLCNQGF